MRLRSTEDRDSQETGELLARGAMAAASDALLHSLSSSLSFSFTLSSSLAYLFGAALRPREACTAGTEQLTGREALHLAGRQRVEPGVEVLRSRKEARAEGLRSCWRSCWCRPGRGRLLEPPGGKRVRAPPKRPTGRRLVSPRGTGVLPGPRGRRRREL